MHLRRDRRCMLAERHGAGRGAGDAAVPGRRRQPGRGLVQFGVRARAGQGLSGGRVSGARRGTVCSWRRPGRPPPRRSRRLAGRRRRSPPPPAGRRGSRPGEAAGKRLAPYEEKRDFTQTPEPPGQPGGQRTRTQSTGPGGKAGGPRFAVQRHRARRLHYDLRFEIDGVLVSWAVPKGPTLDPDVRHAAIHVEDHPIEYLDFEGVIPSGQYGGGDVIVWDTGTWEPHATDDPAAAVAAGDFHADLHGQKLRGRFILVRRGEPDRSGKEQWLLLHKHDEYAVKGWNPEDYPESVLSGRTNDGVKAAPDRMWRSDLPPARASVAVNPSGAAPGGRARSTRRTSSGPAAREGAAPGTTRRSRPGQERARPEEERAQPGQERARPEEERARPGQERARPEQELGCAVRRGTRRAGRARIGRHLGRFRAPSAADQPGQGTLPARPASSR